MLIQRKPSQHTCFVTAFAAIMGMTAAELIQKIGHDGLFRTPKDSVFKGQEIQIGHNIQEIIMATMNDFRIIEIIESGMLIPDPTKQCCPNCGTPVNVPIRTPNLGNIPDRIAALLPTHKGVVIGSQEAMGRYYDHAYAWNGDVFLNPDTGGVLTELPLQPSAFYIVEPKHG